MTPEPERLTAIRRDYEAGEISVAAIARRHGLKESAVYRMRRLLGWQARDPDRVAAGGRARRAAADATDGETAAAASTAQMPAAATARVSKRRLIQRLYGAINRKLEQMEVSMTSPEPITAADSERETRALSTLIKTYEKVQALETDLTRDAGAARAAGVAADDQDRKREALAERIRKVRERFTADREGDAG